MPIRLQQYCPPTLTPNTRFDRLIDQGTSPVHVGDLLIAVNGVHFASMSLIDWIESATAESAGTLSSLTLSESR